MIVIHFYFFFLPGRIRTTPDFRDYDTEHTVLSLGLFPACYIQQPTDDRVFFRFEAAWDSSLHNSPLLNRVTSSGERIYLTLSAYLEVNDLFLSQGDSTLCINLSDDFLKTLWQKKKLLIMR